MQYLFKHILMRDAVYDMQLRRRLSDLHCRAAEAIEELHASDLAPHYADLAYHYEQAEIEEQAVKYLQKAGDHARETYVVEDAVHYYRRALALLEDVNLPDSMTWTSKVKLYEGLGEMLVWQTEFAEATEAYTSMLEAATVTDDALAQARAWDGLSDVQESQGGLYAALESVEQAEEIARAADARGEMANLLYGKGWMLYRLDELDAALSCGEQALALSRELGEQLEMGRSFNLLGAVHDTLGNHEQATRYKKEAMRLFRDLGDRERVGIMLNNLGVTARVRGDTEAAAVLFREALTIAREIGNRNLEMVNLSNLGGIQVKLGEFQAAEANLRWVIERAEATNAKFPDTYTSLAETYLGLGNEGQAIAAAKHALEIGQSMDAGEFIGAAWRVLGRVAARLSASIHVDGETYNAADCFTESLRIFAEMGAAGERARTLRAWARYELKWGDRERGEEKWQKAREIFERLGMDLEVERMDVKDVV
jgi:tetratricopeptide (TPR) repeat protein